MSNETEVITPEVMPKEALAVISQSGVEQSTVTQLRQAFDTMFGDAEKWAAKAKEIKVTDVTQTREMKLARECRLALREIRCNAENARKRLKADALAKGKAIDGIANVLKALVEPVEAYLQDQEDFAKRVEERRVAELRTARQLACSPYADVTGPITFDLASFSEDQFTAFLDGAKAKQQVMKDAAIKAEQMRLEAEEAERKARAEQERKREEERQAIIAENARKQAEIDRLENEAKEKAEAAAKAALEAKRKADRVAAELRAKAEAERAAADKSRADMQAKLDAERVERERVQAEADAKEKARATAEDAARKAAAEKAEADRKAQEKAAQAPDKEKAKAFAMHVAGLVVPALTTDAGKALQRALQDKVAAFAAWIVKQAEEQL